MPKPRLRSKPRNYLSRREQWRLLLIVMALGLVVILMTEAGKPRNYAWLFGTAREDGDSLPQPPADGPPIDDRIPPKTPAKDPPGTFYSPKPVDPGAAEETSGEYFRGVKPKLLEAIQDNTTFRNEERHAWFNLLGVLQKTDERTLEKAGLGRVTHRQLFEQSNEYRGKLVTIRGRVRRAMPSGVPKNDLGLKRYYQVWVQPDDAPDYPIVVYCLELPEDFPTGMEIEQRAEITGFYFKRWPYNAPGALRTAPTLAAKTARWMKASPDKNSPAQGTSLGPGSVVLVVVLAAVAAAIIAFYVYRRTGGATTASPEGAADLGGLREIDLGPQGEQPPELRTDEQD